MLTHTVPAVFAGGGGFEAVLVDAELDLVGALDELELDGAGVGVAVGVGLEVVAALELAAGVEDAGVEADSAESLFFVRLFFLVAPESDAEVSAAGDWSASAVFLDRFFFVEVSAEESAVCVASAESAVFFDRFFFVEVSAAEESEACEASAESAVFLDLFFFVEVSAEESAACEASAESAVFLDFFFFVVVSEEVSAL